MSQMSEIAAGLKELRHIGEDLTDLADKLTALLFSETAPAAPSATEEPAKQKKEYSLEEVRALLTEKARAGKTAEIKALLRSHGADKLSEISPEAYASLVEEAEKI